MCLLNRKSYDKMKIKKIKNPYVVIWHFLLDY